MTTHGLRLLPPGGGRRYRGTRLVRLGDVLPSGLARLDALGRYLQDVASDDGRDAGIDSNLAWLVRKTVLELRRRPRLGEELELQTWASGSGARWAERRTTICVEGQPIVEASSLWVCVDLITRRPARLPERFWVMFGDAVEDRTVSSRLAHPDPPAEPAPAYRPWPLRVGDLDILGHVNNAATWAAVDDELDRIGPDLPITGAELEYRGPIDRLLPATVASQVTGGVISMWVLAGGSVAASARLTG